MFFSSHIWFYLFGLSDIYQFKEIEFIIIILYYLINQTYLNNLLSLYLENIIKHLLMIWFHLKSIETEKRLTA